MIKIFIVSLLLLSVISLPIIKERVASHPPNWQQMEAAPSNSKLQLHIFIRQQNLDKLEQILNDVSVPSSPQYGNHLKMDEITQLVQASEESLQKVKTWLAENGVQDYQLNLNRDIIEATVDVKTAELLLNTKYFKYQNMETNKTALRCLDYSVPNELNEHIDFVGPTVRIHQDTTVQKIGHNDLFGLNHPKQLRKLYGVGDFSAKNNKTSIGLTGFLNQYISNSDLKLFFKKYDSNSTGRVPIIVGPNAESNPGIEADLDIQYGMSMGAGVKNAYFWSTQGQQPGSPQNEPFLKWLFDVSNATSVPQIFSISYGDPENDISYEYAKRVQAEFIKAGSRGVTIIAASGDNGVGADTGLKQVANFPASSPFITTVGGTQLPFFGTKEEAWSHSSGGFSNLWPRQKYQDSFVKTYLSTAKDLPKAANYNHTGNGFPDVAAIASNVIIVNQGFWNTKVAGTSCASPIFAGMIALLNDIRLEAGKPVLGFLNPLLYANPGIFNDITSGGNGFYCAKGWDPVTGLGTMNFEKFRALIESMNEKELEKEFLQIK